MKLRKISFFILFVTAFLFAKDFDELVLDIINSTGHNAENIGFMVRRIRDGKEIAALNADRQFVTASIQKLFTAAASLDKLGINSRTITRILADGFNRETGEIEGNLYILGGGDPTITAERLWLMVQNLYHAGVRSIPNRLIIDNSLFNIEGTPPGFVTNDNSRAFMAGPSAFAVSFNATTIVIRPNEAGQDASIFLLPERADVPISGRVATATSGANATATTRRNQERGMEVLLAGTVRPNSNTRDIFRQVWDPVSNAAESFRSIARQRGIAADFTVEVGQVDTTETELILRFASETKINSLNSKFKWSNNFTSEMMLLTLAARITQEPATWQSAQEIMESWWRETFPESGEITVTNGSGMGAGNQASASQIADLLCWANRQSWSFEWITTLAVAGIDGTLASRFRRRHPELIGNLRAKTGTLNSIGVSNLAGYFRANGEMYSVVFMANDLETTQYSKWILQEQLVSAIYTAIEGRTR